MKATYLKEMPYCETASYPDFQTSVTSQAFVAWSLQDRNAETAFPPTEQILISNGSSIVAYYVACLRAGFQCVGGKAPLNMRIIFLDVREGGWIETEGTRDDWTCRHT